MSLQTLFATTTWLTLTLTSHAAELPDADRVAMAAQLQQTVQQDLAGTNYTEESSRLQPIKVRGVRIGSFREKKSVSIRPDAGSFRLTLSRIDLTDGRLVVDFSASCAVTGDAHYSTPGATIPVSVTSNYTGQVRVKGQITAKVEFANLVASISDLHVPSMDVSIDDVRWSNDGLDLLRDTVQSAISERLRQEKPAALKKLNEELLKHEFSKSLLKIR